MRIIARSKVVENYTEHPGETFRTSWVSPSRVSDYLTGRCEYLDFQQAASCVR